MSKMHSQTGFTLIELMTVIVIAAIIFSIGIPSFDHIIKRNNIEGMQMKLASSVSTARTEAASRNVLVSMCASNNASSCGGDWSDGWISFEDRDGNGEFDVGDTLIDVYEHTNRYTYRATDSDDNAIARLTFSSQGYMKGSPATLFTICEPDGEASYARGIYVSGSGLMVKTVDGVDSDNTHDNPFDAENGDPKDLSCS